MPDILTNFTATSRPRNRAFGAHNWNTPKTYPKQACKVRSQFMVIHIASGDAPVLGVSKANQHTFVWMEPQQPIFGPFHQVIHILLGFFHILFFLDFSEDFGIGKKIKETVFVDNIRHVIYVEYE